MNGYYYRVADFLFGVYLHETMDADLLLPSFKDFKDSGNDIKDKLFDFYVHPIAEYKHAEEGMVLLDHTVNDMGHLDLYATDDAYLFKIGYGEHRMSHYALVDRKFRHVDAYLHFDDYCLGQVINSLLRVIFSQAIIPFKGISMHASCIYTDKKAYLFLGKSGTGKSTHARLWMKTFTDCDLLNDDNPVVRIQESNVKVYGTPWSGKTNCYKNFSFLVGGMAKLKKSNKNIFKICMETESFISLLPSCSVIKKDRLLYEKICDNIVELSELVRVGILDCKPDPEAAMICRGGLEKEN